LATIIGTGFQNPTNVGLYPGTVAINYLDSPATISATTYKTEFANETAASNVSVQLNNDLSTIILMEIGV
jgi:hypothetical protein